MLVAAKHRILTVSTALVDQTNSFPINLRSKHATALLKQQYPTGLLWCLQVPDPTNPAREVYTQADLAERRRLALTHPVQHGETVEVNGQLYTVRIIGPHEMCAVLEPQLLEA